MKTDKTQTEFNYVGTRPIRPDGVDKVTGRACYGADINLAGILYAKVLRSPHAHAKIISIDCSKALEMEGVFAAVTSDDFPDINGVDFGESMIDYADLSQVIMARNKVLYHGHALAAVAAKSWQIAEQALKKINVEYEVLTPIVDIDAALAADAPILHHKKLSDSQGADFRASNVADELNLKIGDVDAGFVEADLIIERTFTTPQVHQGYIEPHACVVTSREDSSLDIWCSSQGQFMVRAYTAKVLNMEPAKIKVTPAEIGGGFGGKTVVYLEPVAAVLSRKTGRPVKMVMSREEVFRATGPGAATRVRAKIGVKQDGTISAMDAKLEYDAGCFKGAPVFPGALTVFGAYKCPNQRVQGFDIVTNKPKVIAYRAPGAPQAQLVVECVLNEIAVQLKMDPIDLRILNAVEEGDPIINGQHHDKIGLKEVLIAAKEHANYQVALKSHQGRGVGVGYWFNIGLDSSATITVTETGKVNVITGNPDIGGSRASMALLAAEVLGVPYEDIKPIVADTDSVGYNFLTGGSRTTYASGWAVMKAAESLIEDLTLRAASIWKVDVNSVHWQDGQAVAAGEVDKPPLSLESIANLSSSSHGPLVSVASHHVAKAGAGFSFSIADVEVDAETGKVEVLRFTILQDAGKAVHPTYVEGQMQGGAAQGIGWALNEELIFDSKGELENPSFLDYRIPVASDLPMIDTVIIECPNPYHPYGIRGVGEAPICGPVPAIVTAVNSAAHIALNDLPLSPIKILAAIDSK